MTQYTPAEVFPPGEILRDELEARGWTQDVLADILERPTAVVNRIISGKTQITPDTAQGLGQALGTGAQFWMNLESAYRLFLARKKENSFNTIARKARLYAKAPILNMIRRKWIEGSENIDVLEAQVCKFFDILSLENSPKLTALARKSTSYVGHSNEQIAWICRARNIARGVGAAQYKNTTLKGSLDQLHALSRNAEDVRLIPRCLADLGVRLVVVEHLPRTKIDGACLWLDRRSPVIALSMRYDRIDHFWHTLAHELGHIMYGHALSVDSDLVGECVELKDRPAQEEEADAFAGEFLISQAELDAFVQRVKPLFYKSKIEGFAALQKVHPGIVVGQLQHRKEISYSHSRDKLAKVRDILVKSAMTDGWGNEISN